MRMARCWPSLILLIYAYSTPANAATTLSPELTNFVPACAQDCFKSFLDANFPTSDFSSTPTLDCLCSHNSTTGYTVGEGAVQCIISEDRIGFCKGADAKDDVVLDAYTMCDGEPNALPNTHGTIVATLVVQSSMPSIVLVPPQTTTSAPPSSTFSTSTLSPTIPSITTSSSSPSDSSSPSSSTSSFLSSLNTASGAPSPTLHPTASPPLPATSGTATSTPTSSNTLTKPQVVGITVASIGAAAVGLGLVLLFACWKRRRAAKDRDSDLLPFQSDPSNFVNYSNYAKSTKSKKFSFSPFRPAGRREIGPGGPSNGVAAKIPPQVPPRLDTSSPNMFSRRSIRPDTIGIAISPENQVQRKRTSKLLPEKPTLKLQMPPRVANPGPSGLSFSQPAPAPAAPSNGLRQSTATQFEEDEETTTTGGGARDTWGRADTDELETAIGNWQTIRTVNPNPPPSAFFVTGGDGNHWRPSQDSNNDPEYYVKPLTLNRNIGSFSQPRRPDEYPRAARQKSSSPLDAFPAPPSSRVPSQGASYPPKLKIPSGPNTGTSSVYSSRVSSLPAGEPSPLSKQQRKYKQMGPYDAHKSTGSMTSFESADSALNTPTPKTPKTGEGPLSPVVESPASGRSPVSYPKIPKLGMGRLPESTIRMVPPPPQPDFGSIMVKPWRTAELEAARRRRDEELEAQREAVYQTQQARSPQERRRNSLIELQLPLQGPRLPLPERTSSRSHHNAAIPPSNMGINTLPSQQRNFQPLRGQVGNPRARRLPGPGLKPANTDPPIIFTRSSSALSHISEDSSNVSNVSLLAKRRGEQKARDLTLSNENAKGGKWRVLKEGDIEAAKSPTWRPMLSNNNGAPPRGDGGEERRRVLERMEPVELPGTPGWVPRLTPTRRGDELFISVQ